jgi:transcriptional regulator with XRE-family HTH domain
MIIGDRLRLLRETKKLSQGDIEKRTGLLRCYISRVENGHTVPAIETLEKLARAMEVPLYQLFYDGEEPPELPNLPKRKSADDIAWGSKGKEARSSGRFRRLLGRIEESDRRLLVHGAEDGEPLVSYHPICLFPLDRARRFGADVVDDPVYAGHLVDDPH